jgi:hypothetical protein
MASVSELWRRSDLSLVIRDASLLLQYGGIILVILAPVLFFPFSKTLFLAFDLLFRPATREELS